jgi:hypothetical protein
MRQLTRDRPHRPEPPVLAVVASPVSGATLGRSETLVSCQPNTKAHQPKREYGNEEYKAMMLRFVKAYLRRIEAGDLQTLADFVQVRDHMSLALDIAVAAQRNHPTNPASWVGIAKATGLSRSAAQERWGSLGGARRRGGQPSHLR